MTSFSQLEQELAIPSLLFYSFSNTQLYLFEVISLRIHNKDKQHHECDVSEQEELVDLVSVAEELDDAVDEGFLEHE